ncbi:unnamed protein product [marine sediment metagenome]|uniref:Uncharacterized protein n=1 Tax=marine sediment metagenome TaxID=412755 RepID=X1QME0_9ZZZZ
MRLIITVQGDIDDETEGQRITDAVKISLAPFEELDLQVNSKVVQAIEPS